MKVCAFILMLVLFGLNAQTAVPVDPTINPVRWGIKGGINFAKLSGDHIEESMTEFNKGIVIGMFAERVVNETLSVQWEFLYTMKGVSESYHEYDSDVYYEYEYSVENNINLNYIEIPVSFRFKLPTQSGFIPCFYAGGSVGFNVASEVEYDYDYYEYYDDGSNYYEYSESDSGTHDIDNIKELETGLIFGAAVKFPLQNGSLLFDGRYNYGLSTIINEGDANIYNRVWSLTLGYGF